MVNYFVFGCALQRQKGGHLWLCFLTRRHFFRLLFPTRTTPHRHGRPGGDTTRTVKNRRKRKEKREKERSTTGWRAGKIVEGRRTRGGGGRGDKENLKPRPPPRKKCIPWSRWYAPPCRYRSNRAFRYFKPPSSPAKKSIGKGKGRRRHSVVEVRGEVPAWELLRVLGLRLGQTWGRSLSKQGLPPFHVRVIARTRPYKHQSHVQIPRSHSWARLKRQAESGWLLQICPYTHTLRRSVEGSPTSP